MLGQKSVTTTEVYVRVIGGVSVRRSKLVEKLLFTDEGDLQMRSSKIVYLQNN